MGQPISSFAVDGFFFLSGFLIYASSLRRHSISSFLLARFVRLWPALAVSVGLTVALGMIATDAPLSTFLQGDTARFAFRNLLLQGGAYNLTGVHCGETPCNINGSLWTIAWEARCYLALAMLMALNFSGEKLIRCVVFPLSLFFCIVWNVIPHPDTGWFYFGNMIERLWTNFSLGMAALAFKSIIRLSWFILVAIGLFVYAVSDLAGPFLPILHYVLTGYCVLCVGLLTARHSAFSSSWPDLSYGVYIYAFPVMIVLSEIVLFTNPLWLAFVTFLVTLPFATVSWYLIEKPALGALKQWERSQREEAANRNRVFIN